MIRDAGLVGKFLLRGSVTDIPGYLGSLDVAVLCSHSESMSNALLEYMAAGRAIVATDVGANARVLRNGVDGQIVPSGDDRAIADAIRRFVERPGSAAQMAQSARHRVKTHFSRTSMIQHFENFFEELAKKRNPRADSRVHSVLRLDS